MSTSDSDSDIELPPHLLAKPTPKVGAGSTTLEASEDAPRSQFDLTMPIQGSNSHCHHDLDSEALATFVYPVNKPVRDYQRNMVRKALIRNIICAIPTGLGKTLIASTVMWNWYRWTTSAKLIFMAPTRPLVTQQVTAFLGMTDVPLNDACVFLSDVVKLAEREQMWRERRVFFATPQTVENDLANGYFDAQDVVCIVVDEAHRATGNHSYVNVIKSIYSANEAVRILALTATPSGKFEGVQQVVDNLHISSTEIRTEESLDVRQYTHQKHISKIVCHPDENMKKLFKLCRALVDPFLQEFSNLKIIHTSNVLEVHYYVLMTGVSKWVQSKRANWAFAYRAKAAAIQPIVYAVNLLQTHGIVPFYQRIEEVWQDYQNDRGGKSLKAVCQKSEFKAILTACREVIYDEEGERRPTFFSHTKLKQLKEILSDFYRVSGAASKCIVFCQYRDSANEVQWVLDSIPQCRPSLFVGQSKGKGGEKGMTQKQQRVLLDRLQTNEINCLIATSVAEEGLDIAAVDLVVCYDQSSSPIKSIQRMGRTGRARDGLVYMLMTEKESKKLEEALSGHKWVENRINSTKNGESTIALQYRPSNRILPPNTVQRYTEVKVPEREFDLDDLRPTKRRKAKRQPKKSGLKQTTLQWAGQIPQSGEDEDESENEPEDEYEDEDLFVSAGAHKNASSAPSDPASNTALDAPTSAPPGSAGDPIVIDNSDIELPF